MFKMLIAEETTTNSGGNSWIFLLVIGLMFVGMMVFSFVSQRKRQKKATEMMSAIAPGDKIMTIGRMIGFVISTNNETNTLLLNVGTEENPTFITIDKAAVGYVMQKGNQSAPQTSAAVSTDDTKEKL